ncbi:tail fiber assembly protein [Pseudomonas putida]|uniref:tail fiber assembly protein n=1 Tax=Pseudomonas putida TaxID=303 RepID=UPI003D97D167
MVEFIDGLATSPGEVPVYRFSELNGEYMGSDIEHVLAGFGLSAGATAIQPPTPTPETVAIWSGAAWTLELDNRGPVYSTTDGAMTELKVLGSIPNGFTELARPTADYIWSQDAWEFDQATADANAISAQMAVEKDVLSQLDQYLAEATLRMGPLQDRVDLGIATGEQSEQLNAWKRYRIELSEVPQQAGWPWTMEWPVTPVQ